jgi:hypothetical protein
MIEKMKKEIIRRNHRGHRPELRDKLFDIEMAIFMNQFLWRTIYWDR